jgi:CheY-like chemotaxis protein
VTIPTILVIDDNVPSLRVLNQLITKTGANCIMVSDPTTIENVLPTIESIDVVFVDLEMPGLDGFSVKDILRAYLPDTPIIAYTVHVSEMDVVRQTGFDGFLGKPVDGARFPTQFARILRHERIWERT